MKKLATIVFIFLSVLSLSAVAFVQISNATEYNYFKELYNPPQISNSSYLARMEINRYIVGFKGDQFRKLIDFYTEYTGNEAITLVIFQKSIEYGMPINLAFSLAHEESRFNPKAVNKNDDGSIDRGLFQLNSASRKHWRTKDFFDIERNADDGIRYWVQECNVKKRPIPLTFIAYNMGPYSEAIRAGVIPPRRAEYVNNILAYEDMLNLEFNSRFIKR